MKTIFNLLLCLFFTLPLVAQKETTEVGFAIVYASEDYNSALQTAREASEKLNIPLNLRDYYFSEKENTLVTDSACGCGENHGYIARGRYDNGMYVSVEHTNSYQNFTDGYYVVIIGSEEKGYDELAKTLTAAKPHYPTAYIKYNEVYMGCMH